MPFRLTRNLQTFFTPFGVEGVFITGLSVAAMVSYYGAALFCSVWATSCSRLEGGISAGLSMAGAQISKCWAEAVLACLGLSGVARTTSAAFWRGQGA